MGSIDDALAALQDPDRACLQHVIDTARAVHPDDVVREIVRLRSLEITGS